MLLNFNRPVRQLRKKNLDHPRFFQELKPYCRTPDVICVHAGIDPDGRLESQDPSVFIWALFGDPEDYRGDEPVVYGHWNNAVIGKDGRPQPMIRANRTYGIDSIQTGVLTAMRFPDLKIFQSRRFPNLN